MNNFDIETYEGIIDLIYNIFGDDFFMSPEYTGPTIVEVLNTIAGD